MIRLDIICVVHDKASFCGWSDQNLRSVHENDYFCGYDLEKHKLDFLADYFKINKGSSHRAFDDAETCRQLFLKCNEVRK